MDELVRLRQFRAAVSPSAESRQSATLDLRMAMAAKPRRLFRPFILAATMLTAAAVATGAYALYRAVIVGSPAPAKVKSVDFIFCGCEIASSF